MAIFSPNRSEYCSVSLLFSFSLLREGPLYLFLVALGLCCCAYARAFSGCGKQWVLPSWGVQASHCCGFSCGRAQPLERELSINKLWHTGLVALRHVESSWTRDQTCVPSIARQTLNHSTTRAVRVAAFLRTPQLFHFDPEPEINWLFQQTRQTGTSVLSCISYLEPCGWRPEQVCPREPITSLDLD